MLSQILRRSAVLAALIVATTLSALPGSARADERESILRPGVYAGEWHGGQVKVIIENVGRDGAFDGIVHFDQSSKWPDARFDFSGKIGRRESLTITRIKDGWNQVAQTGEPKRSGRMLVWKGEVSGDGLDSPLPFELRIPLNR
jgi:hypothetical protein